MNQKPTFIQRIKNISIRKVIALTSLSAVAFTFQACYGTMQDFEDDVVIYGTVVAEDSGEPIPDIKIQLKDSYHSSYSSGNGNFTMYVPINSEYTLLFQDVDGEENGSFYPAKLFLDNSELERSFERDVKLMAKN